MFYSFITRPIARSSRDIPGGILITYQRIYRICRRLWLAISMITGIIPDNHGKTTYAIETTTYANYVDFDKIKSYSIE